MASPYYVAPLGGMQGIQQINQGMQNIAQTAQLNKSEQQKQQVMAEAQRLMQEGNPQAIAAFSAAHPEIGQAMQKGIQFANEATQQNLKESMGRIVAGQDPEQVIQDRIAMVESNGGDASQSRNELNVFQQMGPDAYKSMVANRYAMMFGTEGVPGIDGSGKPAGVREFEELTKAAGLKPGTEGYNKAALVSLGLEPRAGISASERIASDPELARRVAELEAQTATAKETGKLQAQNKILPEIRGAIKQAEAEAKARGEAFGEYDRAKSILPGLRKVVDKLKTLSDVATYTVGGRAFDTVVKELGFGATEGSTARAKMESLVNNQILPLLRDTFGSQFTEREGEQLRKTMLDINAAPEQKKAILDSFIEQKMRDLQSKQSLIQAESGSAQPPQGAQSSESQTVNWSDL